MSNLKYYDRIIDYVKEIIDERQYLINKEKYQSQEEFTEKMTQRFPDLKMNQPAILNGACEGNMDIKMLEFMVSKVKKIKQNQISEHDASVEVGQKLVDEIVKPQIDKSKNSD